MITKNFHLLFFWWKKPKQGCWREQKRTEQKKQLRFAIKKSNSQRQRKEGISHNYKWLSHLLICIFHACMLKYALLYVESSPIGKSTKRGRQSYPLPRISFCVALLKVKFLRFIIIGKHVMDAKYSVFGVCWPETLI